ncbi:hypothetical protein B0A55_08992 [Friedmanniomyces simplex]|uniref:Uncharacterized protein n=1 Tax=Friedmanniomyces simplex TaxID=329884 RepID=A0A4U0WXD6_9PEZI|nr:hypothetical protein B0A55_08992 [Friedmanniomyces simplex]
MNSEATDVLYAILNTITLDVPECCSKHGQATVREWSRRKFLLEQPYQSIRFQLGSTRRGCGMRCVLDILTTIATILKSKALHKLTVDVSNVSPEQCINIRSLLENNKMAVQLPEVGTAVMTLSIGTGDEASEVWADREPSEEEEEEVNRCALQGGDLGGGSGGGGGGVSWKGSTRRSCHQNCVW